MIENPKKIGKYSVLDVAGRGNVGVVYSGYDPLADRKAAIKVCAANDSSADGAARLFRKMFFNEAHTAALLDHPNILKIYLEKDPAKRCGSGLELATDLAKVAGHLNSQVQMSEEEKFRVVRQLSFFTEFSDSEIWEVIRASRWKRCRKGEEIISEGALEQSFYVVVDGQVAVKKDDKQISSLGAGDCFGELGYLTKIRRTANISATAEVTVMQINATMMERASVTCQLRFNKIFLTTLIERLAHTSEELTRAL